MDRLTKCVGYRGNTPIYVLNKNDLRDRPSGHTITKLTDRLGAYEDSELSPERCQELAKAEREGRLVVLWAKPGDAVYIHDNGVAKPMDVVYIDKYETGYLVYRAQCQDMTDDCECGNDSCCGFGFTELSFNQDVFLTREEADDALRKEGGEG